MSSPPNSAPSPSSRKLLDPEVCQKADRRQYSASYKLQILEEVDRCDQPGQVAAILRREGLYSSHLTTWRRQRQAGQIAGLTDNKRGRKPLESHPLEAENEQLRQENQRLMQRLEQVEMIIDIQKKASAMLGIVLGTSSTERKA